MTKHTPGPWVVDKQHYVRCPLAFGGIIAVCSLAPDDSSAEANARLIAAAPDLLEALRWLVNTSCDVGKDGNPPTMNEHIDAIESGKTAIAKAESK